MTDNFCNFLRITSEFQEKSWKVLRQKQDTDFRNSKTELEKVLNDNRGISYETCFRLAWLALLMSHTFDSVPELLASIEMIKIIKSIK